MKTRQDLFEAGILSQLYLIYVYRDDKPLYVQMH